MFDHVFAHEILTFILPLENVEPTLNLLLNIILRETRK